MISWVPNDLWRLLARLVKLDVLLIRNAPTSLSGKRNSQMTMVALCLEAWQPLAEKMRLFYTSQGLPLVQILRSLRVANRLTAASAPPNFLVVLTKVIVIARKTAKVTSYVEKTTAKESGLKMTTTAALIL